MPEGAVTTAIPLNTAAASSCPYTPVTVKLPIGAEPAPSSKRHAFLALTFCAAPTDSQLLPAVQLASQLGRALQHAAKQAIEVMPPAGCSRRLCLTNHCKAMLPKGFLMELGSMLHDGCCGFQAGSACSTALATCVSNLTVHACSLNGDCCPVLQDRLDYVNQELASRLPHCCI